MKLSLKIMTALFIFAVIGIVGCSKNQLGLDADNVQNYEVVTPTDFLTNSNVISVTKNYTLEEFKITGTMYEIKNIDGSITKTLNVDKLPEGLEQYSTSKRGIYRGGTVADGNGRVHCTQNAGDNCWKIGRWVIWRNN